MIELRKDITPSQATLDTLTGYQREIDDQPSFHDRSEKAKEIFPRKNIRSNAAFREIKQCLKEMCNSTRRCIYCEDSLGDEVEHIFPKDLYPDKCFKWENYLYACGPCNGPKNNQFAVFRDTDGEFTIVNPPRGVEATEPPAGDAAMINPRIENPLDYAILDLKDTFLFYPLPGLSVKNNKKAEYTFYDVLRMDNEEREPLRQARANAYENYSARLFQYVEKKNNNASQARLDRMIAGIKKENHPTVWKEMQRYYNEGYLVNVDNELKELFDQAPEALTW
jgi:5-methylcytosine-specific restriction endonuclease McrA